MNEQLRVRQLDQVEVRQIYGTYMQEDFPKNERKPLERILGMLDDDIYKCIGLFAEGHLVSYAFFVKTETSGYYLLDYLAVHKDHRSKGYGSIFLAEMRRYFKHVNGIFLECESEYSVGEWTGESHKTAMQRKKRIQFYRNNGAVLTNIKSILFGVDYSILYYPVKVPAAEVDWYGELLTIYQTMFPATVFDDGRVKLWRRREILLAADRGAVQDEEGVLMPKVSLCDALGIRAQAAAGELRMIALIGSGGKTTAMYQLADELAEMGKKVLVTTSTHIAVPEQGQTVYIEAPAELAAVEWQGQILTAGRAADGENGKKLKAPVQIEECLNYADIVLVEADGSKQLPAKVAAGWEPVIPERTELVIGCFGLQALGKTFGEACFRFAEFGGWMNKDAADVIGAEDAARMLSDARGIRKDVGERPYALVLNQADGEYERQQAAAVIRSLPDNLAERTAVTCYSKETDL